MVLNRETTEGWPLPTFETEANKYMYESSWLVCWARPAGTRIFVLPCLLEHALVGPEQNIFSSPRHTLFQFICTYRCSPFHYVHHNHHHRVNHHLLSVVIILIVLAVFIIPFILSRLFLLLFVIIFLAGLSFSE
jgi:hypothetical protein